MSTKRVNPNDPGQLQFYATDFILATQALTPYQVNVYLLALQNEWQTGQTPESDVWHRFVRPTNQHQRGELDSLKRSYDALPFTLKMREQRCEKLAKRRGRIGDSNPVPNSQPNSEPTELVNGAKANGINETTRKEAGSNPHTSSSTSSSPSVSLHAAPRAHEEPQPLADGVTDDELSAEPDPALHQGNVILREVFGHAATLEGQARIAATVSNFVVWRKVCDDWRVDYHSREGPPKVTRLLEIYAERQETGATNDTSNSSTNEKPRANGGRRSTATQRNADVLRNRRYDDN